LALGFGFSQIVIKLKFEEKNERIEIPDITKMSLKQAEAKLEKLGFILEVKREVYDSNIPEGYVVVQEPLPELYADPNSTIKVTLSKGTEKVIIPELAGMTERKARIMLARNGLSVGNVSYSYSRKFPQLTVITHSPMAQSSIKRGMALDLLVSLGPPQNDTGYIMPNLNGKNFFRIRQILEPLGLRVGKEAEFQDSFLEPGTILAQTPEPGVMISKNENIQLTISIGGEENGY
jgi:eukaryotic-like serine/threonine-protein kinase